MVDLPSDLFTEILSRLPVQSLLRFRSTSKSLKSLIDSHYFTNLHLKNSLNRCLILQHNSELYELDFPNLTAAIPLKYPLKDYISLLGSCNGLLCISNDLDETVALWNPIIRKHRTIPYLPFPHSYTNLFVVHGFAFDPFADDYKLLRISSSIDLIHRIFDSQVRLFTSKTNSWKVLPNMPYAIVSDRDIGVFVENSLHWVVIRKHEQCDQPVLIVAFNITQEIFNEVPLPEIRASTGQSFVIDVSLLGECLCMIVSYQTLNYETTKVDVWVMKEYGFRESWCKLFTLGESCFGTPLITLKPLGYSSNRSKVLLQVDHNKLFWYDFKSEKVTCVLGIPKFNESMVYAGSLLPPPLPIDNCN